MIWRKYKDFNEMFEKVNQEIILKGDMMNLELQGYKLKLIDFMVLESESYNFDLDISKLGYTKRKWPSLVDSYIEKEELDNFYNMIKTTTAPSCTLYFKRKKVIRNWKTNSIPCLLSLVVSKKDHKSKTFDEAFVYYRTTELNRKFPVDLALIQSLLKEAGGNGYSKSYICDSKSFHQHILPSSYY